MPLVLTILLISSLFLNGPAAGQGEALSSLLEGMGDLHHPITTRDPRAQRFFDQGLTLSYAFNHAAAERSFREAARLDPECAMCFWAIALVQGPNINAAMDPATAPTAWKALRRAQELAANARPAERDYIAALARRYAAEPPADRAPLWLHVHGTGVDMGCKRTAPCCRPGGAWGHETPRPFTPGRSVVTDWGVSTN